ncbi:MAG TPA: hypothetical protein VEQ41_03850 [Solirubrobacterales bacterium]|nr:hypothetical protein [Solirubrobacterales bacterium]
MTARGRLVTVAAAFVLLVGGALGCGDDSDSSPPADGGAQANEMDSPGSARGGREGAGPDERDDRDPGAGQGVDPAQRDSGGGSEQFATPGGDNSVQEFGAEAEGGELEAAAATLHAFLDARAAGDWAKACDQLAADVLESFQQFAERSPQLRGKECPEVLAGLSGPGTKDARREAAIADGGALRVEGDRGFVLYHGAGDTPYAIPMRLEDGRWKVAALAGLPLS